MPRYEANFNVCMDRSPGPYYIFAQTFQIYNDTAHNLRLNPEDKRMVRPLIEPYNFHGIGDPDIIKATLWDDASYPSYLNKSQSLLERHVALTGREFDNYVGDPPVWFMGFNNLDGLQRFVTYETLDKLGQSQTLTFNMDYFRRGLTIGGITDQSLGALILRDRKSRPPNTFPLPPPKEDIEWLQKNKRVNGLANAVRSIK